MDLAPREAAQDQSHIVFYWEAENSSSCFKMGSLGFYSLAYSKLIIPENFISISGNDTAFDETFTEEKVIVATGLVQYQFLRKHGCT